MLLENFRGFGRVWAGVGFLFQALNDEYLAIALSHAFPGNQNVVAMHSHCKLQRIESSILQKLSMCVCIARQFFRIEFQTKEFFWELSFMKQRANAPLSSFNLKPSLKKKFWKKFEAKVAKIKDDCLSFMKCQGNFLFFILGGPTEHFISSGLGSWGCWDPNF